MTMQITPSFTPAFTIGQGDLQPPLVAVLRDATGAAVDLSSATSIALQLWTPQMAPLALAGTAVKAADQTAHTGQVTYTWAVGDTATRGVFLGRFVVQFPSGQQSFPDASPDGNPADGYFTVEVG